MVSHPHEPCERALSGEGNLNSDQEIKTGQDAGAYKQAEPKNDVTKHFSALHELCVHDADHGNLQQLHGEQVASDFLKQAGHDEFVDQRRQEERDERSCRFRQPERRDRRVVDVPQQEMVDGPVPVPRVVVEAGTVPPQAVEIPRGEQCDFGEDVEHALLRMGLVSER